MLRVYMTWSLRAIWLNSGIVLVVIMIGIGGVTRLTKSGLSIAEWQPVSGFLPPLTEISWQKQFSLYQETSEFKVINTHFQLGDYKKIFFWEWVHRFMARFIFIWFFAGGLFLYRIKLSNLSEVVLLSTSVLAQGVLGWLMVSSGLKQNPQVNIYLMALHFFAALALILVTFLIREKISVKDLLERIVNSRKIDMAFSALILFQIFYGCLVAGTKAGFVYNEFPLMGGDFFPQGAFYKTPFLRNLTESVYWLQFIHRWTGFLILGIGMYLLSESIKNSATSKNSRKQRRRFFGLLGHLTFQVAIGVLTLLFKVPVYLGALHQVLGAMIFYNVLQYLLKSPSPFELSSLGSQKYDGNHTRIEKSE